MIRALVPFGAEPPPQEEPEPTDTFTIDLRELRERERRVLGDSERPSTPPGRMLPSGQVRGEVILALRRFLSERFGDGAVRDLVRQHASELAVPFFAEIDPDGWCSAQLLGVVEVADERLGGGDRRLLADAGRFLARETFGEGAMSRTVTPELFFSSTGELWKRLFGQGRAKVHKVSRGHGRLVVTEPSAARLSRSVVLVGYLDEVLRMAGARDVDVRLARSEALGDEADVYEATWSS